MKNLIGNKIILRKLKYSDAKKLFKIFTPEVRRYLDANTKKITLETEKKFVRKKIKQWEDKQEYHFGIEDKECKKIIGIISLTKIDYENKNTMMGYWISKSYWREGICSEAVKLIVKLVFEKMKFERLEARVYHPNTPSALLLGKYNFKYEGEMRRKKFSKKDGWLDSQMFGLIKKDYVKK